MSDKDEARKYIDKAMADFYPPVTGYNKMMAYSLLSIAISLQELVAVGRDLISLLADQTKELPSYTITWDDPNVSAT